MPFPQLRFSHRGHGDLHIGADPSALDRRRQELAPHPWTWLRQVHGAEVVVVDAPGGGAGTEADAAVTATPGAVLAVHTADCVPVLLFDADAGVVGAAHAGWRGLVAGVVGATVDAMAALGARRPVAHVGPHIRSRCYEFGSRELDEVAEHLDDRVRATTAWGTPALDLSAAVGVALARRDVEVHQEPGCTACEPDRFFSHRARGDAGRQAGVVWVEP